MNVNKAFQILELYDNKIYSKEEIKHQYHKLALKWHPDKNQHNLEISNIKFKDINEAYQFLIHSNTYSDNSNTHSNNSNTYSDENENKMYNNILFKFLKIIIGNDYLISIINNIITNTTKITETIFEGIDIHTAINLYNLLYKYNDIFHINTELLNMIANIIKQKYENNEIIILHSTIDDLWKNNIYKLYLDDELYLVPLWHNELYFQKKNKNNNNKDLIILCNPELPENVIIDEDNNIIMSIIINIQNELHNLLNFNENYKIVNIGQQSFAIPIHELNIKPKQIYKFKGQGISKISENNMYDINSKSDVIFYIYLQ